MIRHWIVEPRHGFFGKDARGWFAGAGNQANSLPWLHPTTLRGAICSAIGRELEQQQGRVFSPSEWLDLKSNLKLRHALAARLPIGTSFAPAYRVWSAPADAVHLHSNTGPHRMMATPAEVEIWDSGDDPKTQALQLLTLGSAVGDADAKPERGPTWWTEAEFVDWLCGAECNGPVAALASGRQPLARTDLHVKMSADTETAEPGFLWANEFRETLTVGEHRDQAVDTGLADGRTNVYRWAFGVSLEVASENASSVFPTTAVLAGDRHLASILDAGDDIAKLPKQYEARLRNDPPLRRLRLFATSPTVFQNGWCPDGFSMQDGNVVGALPGIDTAIRLVAVAVGRPVAISGWDLAASDSTFGDTPRDSSSHASGAPRVTQLACPPGTMWLVERLDGQSFRDSDIKTLWLAAWGKNTSDGLGGFVAGLDPAN